MPASEASPASCQMTELVLPNDTNTLGNLMGGRLMHLMDVCAAIAAQRHARRTVVTASVDSVDFRAAVALGEVVVLEAVVTRAFRTSMEVAVEVRAENNVTGEARHCNRAFLTFVAVDADGRPTPVPPVEPRTDAERARYEAAGRRRDLRLVLAGRLALEDAASLRDALAELALDPPI